MQCRRALGDVENVRYTCKRRRVGFLFVLAGWLPDAILALLGAPHHNMFRHSSWMKRQHSKYDNMILHYRQKRYTVGIAYSSISNRPKTSKNMHMQGWIPGDSRRKSKEISSLCSLWVFTYYQKSDHLFVPPTNSIVPGFSRIFCMKCISKIRAKNS